MRRIGTLATLLVACAAAVVLSACRDEEQHRLVTFEKGTYQGRPDTPVDQKVSAGLQDRVKKQSY